MLIAQAGAKLNLALEVTARAPDGWHEIDSLLMPIDWHDLVGVVGLASGARGVSLRVTGPFAAAVPHDGTNLAVRAGAALLEMVDAPVHLQLWLDKHVPAAAGLGGGSADAAAVLRAGTGLLAGFGPGITGAALRDIAMRVGSDVPALLEGGVQRVRGRGDRLEPLPPPLSTLHVAVAVAGASSTGAAYRALLASEITASGRVDRAVAWLANGMPEEPALEGGLESALGSALESPACRAAPQLAASIARLRALTPHRSWHLTGSGGALFCLARDRADAIGLAERARSDGFVARACRSNAAAPRHG